jgi:hypothetical protein
VDSKISILEVKQELPTISCACVEPGVYKKAISQRRTDNTKDRQHGQTARRTDNAIANRKKDTKH